MPDIPDDDTAMRFSLLELGDSLPPKLDTTPAAPPPEPTESIRPANWGEEVHGHRCGLQIIVSMFTPRVFCDECKADLDPFDVLRKYATGERNFIHLDLASQHKVELLKREIAELTKIRNNLRSQVRHGNGKRGG